MLRALFGLGNPRREYEKTRHNLGCMLADRLAGENRFSKKDGFLIAEFELSEARLLVGKPLVFMNDNGQAVRKLLRKYSLQPSEILVAYDDADLPLGRIRIRERGGSGGAQRIAFRHSRAGD